MATVACASDEEAVSPHDSYTHAHFDVVHHLAVWTCPFYSQFRRESPLSAACLPSSYSVNGIHKRSKILPVFLTGAEVFVLLLLLLRCNDFFIVLVAVGARVGVGDAHVEDAVPLASPEAVAGSVAVFAISGLISGGLLLCRSVAVAVAVAAAAAVAVAWRRGWAQWVAGWGWVGGCCVMFAVPLPLQSPSLFCRRCYECKVRVIQWRG